MTEHDYGQTWGGGRVPPPYVCYHPGPTAALLAIISQYEPKPAGWYLIEQRGCVVDISGPFDSEAEGTAHIGERAAVRAARREARRAERARERQS